MSYRASDWYQNWRPWMTLNGIMAITSCYFTELGSHVGLLRQSGLSYMSATKKAQRSWFSAIYDLWWYSQILRDYQKECIKEVPHIHSKVRIWLVQHCAAISAKAELSFLLLLTAQYQGVHTAMSPESQCMYGSSCVAHVSPSLRNEAWAPRKPGGNIGSGSTLATDSMQMIRYWYAWYSELPSSSGSLA